MPHLDAELFGKELAVFVADQIAKALAPLQTDLAVLKAQLASLPAVRDGKDADPEAMRAFIRAEVSALPPVKNGIDGQNGTKGETGADGKSVTIAEVLPVIQELVAAKVASVPPAKDGVNGKDADQAIIKSMVKEAMAEIRPPRDGTDGTHGTNGAPGEKGEPGKDGASIDPAAVAAMVEQVVDKRMSVIKIPRDGIDGKSVTAEDVRPLLEKMVAAIPPARDGAPGENGKDGASVDPAFVIDMVKSQVREVVSTIPAAKDGKDGKDVDPAWVIDLVAKGFEALPIPKDGKDGTSVDEGAIVGFIAKALDAMPKPKDGRDGKDADMAQLEDVALAAAIAEVAKIPIAKDGEPGKDGKSVTAEEVLPLLLKSADPVIQECIAKAVSLIPAAKDGRDVDPEFVVSIIRSQVERAYASFPIPQDGVDGRDGKDGMHGMNALSLDDFGFDLEDDGRTLVLSLRSGNREQVRKVKLAMPIYRGVFRAGVKYACSDTVTYAGSMWVAQKDTSETPPSDGAWTLAVKRGRDGNDAS